MGVGNGGNCPPHITKFALNPAHHYTMQFTVLLDPLYIFGLFNVFGSTVMLDLQINACK